MITVLGRRNSANVQKVMWTLGELDLPYRREDIGGSFGYPEDYPNPNQVVPSMHDGDVTVWESNACVRYLAQRYGSGSLYPNDPQALATAESWTEWQRSDFSMAFFPMFMMAVRGAPGGPEKIADKAAATGRALTQLDQALTSQTYIGGDALSYADIVLGTLMYRYMTLPIERPSLPALEAWYHRLVSRPAYQKHVMIEYGSNPEEWLAHEQANAGIQ